MNKTKIVMDLTQEESDRLDITVKALDTTKVGFIRKCLDEDMVAIMYYIGLARQCKDNYSVLADARLNLSYNSYHCHIDTEKWIASVYCSDYKIHSFVLD